MLIIGILGGVAITALWFFFGISSQTEDYAYGRQEIENAFQIIGRDITNAGLGMPNNRSERGTFTAAFRGRSGNNPPLALWGAPDAPNAWGGPVILGNRNNNPDGNPLTPTNVQVMTTTDVDSEDVYIGPELYFAWAVPTGVRVNDQETGLVSSDTTVTFQLLQPADMTRLVDFSYDRRAAGILPAGSPTADGNLRAWILFPSFRIPMLITARDVGANTITVEVAPESSTRPTDPLFMRAFLGGYEEVHVPQACRIFVRDDELRQQFYESNSNTSTRVLARGIAGVFFKYNPKMRLVTMYIAAKGRDPIPVGKQAPGLPDRWPSFAASAISAADQRYRLLVESITWRIRN